MVPSEALKLRPASHRAVGVHHLADHPRRKEAGQTRQVHRPLRLAGADQHAAGAGAQRKDVPRPNQVARLGIGSHGGAYGARAILRGDAGGNSARGLDRDGEGGLVGRGVFLDHQGEIELPDSFLGQREANQPAPVRGHEVDRVGGHLLGGHYQVPLVFSVLVVGEDDHPAAPDLRQRLFDQRDAVQLLFAHRLAPRTESGAHGLLRDWPRTPLKREQPGDVLADQIGLNIHPVSHSLGTQSRSL